MLLCDVEDLLIAEQFLNNTSYEISVFSDKVRITCILDHDSFVFISIIHNIDLLPLRTFIGPISRLSTPITLSDLGLGIEVFFALHSCWLLVVVLTQGLWPSVELAASQLSWNSAKFLRHLMALRFDIRRLKGEAMLCSLSIFMALLDFINREHVVKNRAFLDGVL